MIHDWGGGRFGGGYLGDPGRAHRYFDKNLHWPGEGGGGTWGIQAEHTGILTKNSNWILYFLHRLSTPNVAEQPLFTYYLLQKNFDQKVYLNARQKTKSTYYVSLKLDNKAKAQHQLVGPAWWSSLTDQFFIFEALPSFHIQITTFQLVHCRSFRVRQRCCLWNSWSKHWINLNKCLFCLGFVGLCCYVRILARKEDCFY